jgi:hypothetical protein
VRVNEKAWWWRFEAVGFIAKKATRRTESPFASFAFSFTILPKGFREQSILVAKGVCCGRI